MRAPVGDEGVARRSAFAAAITALSRAFARGLQLISSLILTRLLLPEAFGLMAQAAVLLQMLQLLSDLGIQTALVQLKNGHRRGYLDAAFAVAVLRSLTLFCIALLLAGPVARFYGDARLEYLIYILSLSILALGCENPAYASVIKNLQARTQALLEGGAALATLLITVGLVLYERSVWSLAIGSVCGTLLRTLGSYLVARPLPRLRFRRAPLLRLLSMCSRLLLNTFATWLAMNLDVLVIGRILDMEQLGFYNIGRNLALTGELLLIPIVARSYFPAAAALLAQSGEDHGPQSTAFARLYGQHALVFAGLGGLAQVALALAAVDVVTVLYPEAYSAVVPVVGLLALRGVFRIVSILQSGLLFAAERTAAETRAMLAGLFILAGSCLWFHYTPTDAPSRLAFANATQTLLGFWSTGHPGELSQLALLVCLAALPITLMEAVYLVFRLRVATGAVLAPYFAAFSAPLPVLLFYFTQAQAFAPGIPRLAAITIFVALTVAPALVYLALRLRKRRAIPARREDQGAKRTVLHCTLINPAVDRNGVAVHINALVRGRKDTAIATPLGRPGAMASLDCSTAKAPEDRTASTLDRALRGILLRIRTAFRAMRVRAPFPVGRDFLYLCELLATAAALYRVMRASIQASPRTVLHCHDVISGRLALILRGETIVLTAHFWCNPEDEFARAGLVRRGGLAHRILGSVARFVLAHPRVRLVSVSRAARNSLSAYRSRPDTFVIAPCIDRPNGDARFQALPVQHAPKIKTVFRIVLVGTIEARKDQRRLIRIARILRRAPGRTEFHVYGNDANREGRLLNALIERYDLKETIRMHGARPPGEVQLALQNADLYLQLSRAESFGMALVEAMAHGRAVLARDYPALKEIAPDCAIIPRHAQSFEIALCIQALARSSRRRHWNAIQARDAYERRFTPERIRRRHESLYELVS